jgi:hypothetical protein
MTEMGATDHAEAISDAQPVSTLCVQCSARPRLGALSRCKVCLKADTARDHKQRGHGAKIDEAIEALKAEGKLPRNLRTVERDRRILEWLTANGYGSDLPSRTAIARHFGGM